MTRLRPTHGSAHGGASAGAAMAVGATALVCAAVAIVAGLVGPLVAHPRPAAGALLPAGAAKAPPEKLLIPPAQWPPGPGVGWLWWIGLALSIVIVVAIVWWLVQALRRPSRPTPMAAPGASAQLIGAMLGDLSEPAIADLGDARSFQAARAADDIIASWEVVEKAAAAFGFPRPAAATPTEFMRYLVTDAGDAGINSEWLAHIDDAVRAELLPTDRTVASAVLLKLYHRARFDTVALAPGAATVARAAARGLVESWGLLQRKRVEDAAAAAAAAEILAATGRNQ
ncbi:MAG: hypothetical protein ABI034_03530 [Nakamurella sp.]